LFFSYFRSQGNGNVSCSFISQICNSEREIDWVEIETTNSEMLKLIEKERLNQRYPSNLWIETWVHGKFEFKQWEDIWFQRNILVSRWDHGEIRRLDEEGFWTSGAVSPRFNNISYISKMYPIYRESLLLIPTAGARVSFQLPLMTLLDRRLKFRLFSGQNVRSVVGSI
jgi:hypothetical protein